MRQSGIDKLDALPVPWNRFDLSVQSEPSLVKEFCAPLQRDGGVSLLIEVEASIERWWGRNL